jgi:hypothetical protein
MKFNISVDSLHAMEKLQMFSPAMHIYYMEVEWIQIFDQWWCLTLAGLILLNKQHISVIKLNKNEYPMTLGWVRLFEFHNLNFVCYISFVLLSWNVTFATKQVLVKRRCDNSWRSQNAGFIWENVEVIFLRIHCMSVARN